MCLMTSAPTGGSRREGGRGRKKSDKPDIGSAKKWESLVALLRSYCPTGPRFALPLIANRTALNRP